MHLVMCHEHFRRHANRVAAFRRALRSDDAAFLAAIDTFLERLHAPLWGPTPYRTCETGTNWGHGGNAPIPLEQRLSIERRISALLTFQSQHAAVLHATGIADAAVANFGFALLAEIDRLVVGLCAPGRRGRDPQ